MQGNCGPITSDQIQSFNITGAPLEPVPKGRCLIVSDTDVFAIGSGSVWIDGLYIRHHLADDHVSQGSTSALVSVTGDAQAYITNVLFQGDGENKILGLQAARKAQALVQGDQSALTCDLMASFRNTEADQINGIMYLSASDCECAWGVDNEMLQ